VAAYAELVADGPDADFIPPDEAQGLLRYAYAEHAAPLFRFVLGKTGGDRQLAEDVVQETMLRTWRNAGQIDSARALRPWLYTVARHIVIDLHRGRTARPTEVGDEALEHAAGPDEIDRALTAQTVRALLATLPERHREALVEVYLRGRRIDEAAEILGVPPGTVKSRVYYALRMLRDKLTSEGLTDIAG
jgi:RNA polymerase sigma-70 factor (ECF subfamily)